ncbi:hypothetical protein SY85_07835 [Flavisolibacter tropicus]|uniref:Uncharacterized protein n=1 Tax=Flavisolibacter tropicus TaxID=1492898 RepID=A0A172TTV3_9BACT|nr:hypothetical protein SY85_07835 [Flavisolibacter tropicus]
MTESGFTQSAPRRGEGVSHRGKEERRGILNKEQGRKNDEGRKAASYELRAVRRSPRSTDDGPRKGRKCSMLNDQYSMVNKEEENKKALLRWSAFVL